MKSIAILGGDLRGPSGSGPGRDIERARKVLAGIKPGRKKKA